MLLRNVNDTERVVCVGRREDNSRRDKTRYTNATLMNVMCGSSHAKGRQISAGIEVLIQRVHVSGVYTNTIGILCS